MKLLMENRPLQVLLVLIVLVGLSLLHVPRVLNGERLIQGDKLQFKASSHSLKLAQQKTGELPHWTNDMYGGMPANFIYPKYPSNLVYSTLHAQFVANELKMLALPALFIWLALALVGTNWLVALICAIAYGFTTVVIGNIEAGHTAKVLALGTVVPLLVGVHAVLNGKSWIGFLLVTLFTSIILACNHPQIAYYTVLVVALLILVQTAILIRKRTIKQLLRPLGILAVAGIIGVLPNVSMLWSSYSYSQETVRGKQLLDNQEANGLSQAYINEYSHSFMELLSVIVPRAVGGSSSEILDNESATFKVLAQTGIEPNRKLGNKAKVPLFWGDKPQNGAPTYLGVVFFCLFCLSFYFLSRGQKVAISAMFALTLIIVLGGNSGFINDLLYGYLPLYSKFRAPSMAIGITSAIMVFAMGLGLNKALNSESELTDAYRPLLMLFGSIAGVLLVLALAAPAVLNFNWEWGMEQAGIGMDGSIRRRMLEYGYPESSVNAFFRALVQDRAEVFRSDVLRSCVLVIVFLGLIALSAKGMLKLKHALTIACLVGAAELFMVNRQYLNDEDFSKQSEFESVYPASESTQRIERMRADHDRMLDATTSVWTDARPAYYLPTIGGMNGAKLRRFQDLIDEHLNSEIGAIRSAKRVAATPVLNMLNTRFIKTGPGYNDYLENVTALGAAWFVDSVKWVSSSRDEINTLSTIDLTRTAVVHDEFRAMVLPFKSHASTYSSIEMLRKTPYEVVYRTVSDQPEFMVMSEIWYKGNDYWPSTVDGKEVDHMRVNYALRGIQIPKGEHVVRFEYHDRAFDGTEPIAAAGSGILILTLIASAYFAFRKSLKPHAEA